MTQQNKQLERFITKTIFFSLITFNFLHGADARKAEDAEALETWKDQRYGKIFDLQKMMSYDETQKTITLLNLPSQRKVNLKDIGTLRLLTARGDKKALNEIKQTISSDAKHLLPDELAKNVICLPVAPNIVELELKAQEFYASGLHNLNIDKRVIDRVSKEYIKKLQQNTANAFQYSQKQARFLNYDIGLLIGTQLGGLFAWYTLNLMKSRNYHFIANNFINTNRCMGAALAVLTAYIAYKCYNTAQEAQQANEILNAVYDAESSFEAEDPDASTTKE